MDGGPRDSWPEREADFAKVVGLGVGAASVVVSAGGAYVLAGSLTATAQVGLVVLAGNATVSGVSRATMVKALPKSWAGLPPTLLA